MTNLNLMSVDIRALLEMCRPEGHEWADGTGHRAAVRGGHLTGEWQPVRKASTLLAAESYNSAQAEVMFEARREFKSRTGHHYTSIVASRLREGATLEDATRQ